MISMEAGGPSAVNSNVILAPRRERAVKTSFKRQRLGCSLKGDNTGTIHFWRSSESRECCHCPPSADVDALIRQS